MNTLNFLQPEKSSIGFQALVFPDGQPHIKFDMASVVRMDKSVPLRILCRINNPSDLMMLLLAKNTLDYLEFEYVELCITYLMAARMDRVMLDGEPFSLKVVAQTLDLGHFKKVKIFDPHSEVATAVINRSYPVANHEYVKEVIAHFLACNPGQAFCLVSPDAGALKKIHKLAQFLNITHVVECMKERDLRTGTLTNFKTTAESLDGLTCIIVDDICDGGGTFAGTAALLKEKGASKVILVVSHGIFSKGIDIPGIDTIYTTDSYRYVESVNCFPVDRYML